MSVSRIGAVAALLGGLVWVVAAVVGGGIALFLGGGIALGRGRREAPVAGKPDPPAHGRRAAR